MHDYDDRKPKMLMSVPPPSGGYWGWVRDELREKANKEWILSELKALRRSFEDTKTTVTDVRKATERPYECSQEKEIEKLKDWQYKMMNWKIPAIITVLVLVLGAAGQYFSLKDSVEDGNQAREEVQKTLKHIQVQQVEASKAIDAIKEQATISDIERRKDMESFAKQVAHELKPKEEKVREKRKKKRGND